MSYDSIRCIQTVLNPVAPTQLDQAQPEVMQVPVTRDWLRYVWKGSAIIGGVQYGVGAHDMAPTQGGFVPYQTSEQTTYVDVIYAQNVVVQSTTLCTGVEQFTADTRVLIIHEGSNVNVNNNVASPGAVFVGVGDAVEILASSDSPVLVVKYTLAGE